jgi:hypothetical protein
MFGLPLVDVQIERSVEAKYLWRLRTSYAIGCRCLRLKNDAFPVKTEIDLLLKFAYGTVLRGEC